MSVWRTGNKVKLNVYEGDRPAFQCHTPEEAARIVALLNDGAAARRLVDAARAAIANKVIGRALAEALKPGGRKGAN